MLWLFHSILSINNSYFSQQDISKFHFFGIVKRTSKFNTQFDLIIVIRLYRSVGYVQLLENVKHNIIKFRLIFNALSVQLCLVEWEISAHQQTFFFSINFQPEIFQMSNSICSLAIGKINDNSGKEFLFCSMQIELSADRILILTLFRLHLF